MYLLFGVATEHFLGLKVPGSQSKDYWNLISQFETLCTSHHLLYRHQVTSIFWKERRAPTRALDRGLHRHDSPAVGHEWRDRSDLLALLFGHGDEVKGRRPAPEPDLAIKTDPHAGRLPSSPLEARGLFVEISTKVERSAASSPSSIYAPQHTGRAPSISGVQCATSNR